jgi:hypothetical protein
MPRSTTSSFSKSTTKPVLPKTVKDVVKPPSIVHLDMARPTLGQSIKDGIGLGFGSSIGHSIGRFLGFGAQPVAPAPASTPSPVPSQQCFSQEYVQCLIDMKGDESACQHIKK